MVGAALPDPLPARGHVGRTLAAAFPESMCLQGRGRGLVCRYALVHGGWRMWSCARRYSVAWPVPFRACPSRWFRPAFPSRGVLRSSRGGCWSWPCACIEGRVLRGLVEVSAMGHRRLRRVRVSIAVLAPLTMRRVSVWHSEMVWRRATRRLWRRRYEDLLACGEV